jgi:hypothetical protein
MPAGCRRWVAISGGCWVAGAAVTGYAGGALFAAHHAESARSARARDPVRLVGVVLVFEILLVACVLVITWFALYTLYRLISDES